MLDFKLSGDWNRFLIYLRSYNFLITVFIFLKVFDLLESLNRILQATDVLSTLYLVNSAKVSIAALKNDEQLKTIYSKVR